MTTVSRAEYNACAEARTDPLPHNYSEASWCALVIIHPQAPLTTNTTGKAKEGRRWGGNGGGPY